MFSRRLVVLALLAGAAGCFSPMHTQSPPRAPTAPPPPGAPIDRATLLRLDPRAVMYLDVRSAREFSGGHIPFALNVPLTEVNARFEEIRILAEGRPVIVYCSKGKRADAAVEILAGGGLTNTRRLTGGYRGWVAAGLPIEHEEPPTGWFY